MGCFLLNLAVLVPSRSGGSGGFIKHLQEVVPRWVESRRLGRLSILAPEGLFEGLDQLGAELIHVPRDDYRSGFRRMGGIASSGQYDVALNTTARPVKLVNLPVLTMVQNIEPIQRSIYPMPLLWRMRLWALRREHAIACRQSTRILAVSMYVKEEICRRFMISPDKIDVVYHGFDPHELDTVSKPDIDVQSGEFIFSAGSIVPYRGYEDIIRALALVRRQTGIDIPAVLAGSPVGHAASYEHFLHKLAKNNEVDDIIYWAGQLSREQMSWCFMNAKMFIQTSRAEACPNIVLEAMGSGCLNISCDQKPMQEFFKNAAIYYTAGCAEELSDRMITLSEFDDARVFTNQKKSNFRSEFFHWGKTAGMTLDSIEKLVC